MKIKLQHGIVAAALAAAGCSLLPSVGPDYSQPEIELPAFDLPDAGAPTTNLTATGEYRAADAEADARALITTNDVASWWLRFDDPILADLVECAVSNNVSYLMAQERLTASRWQLLGSYAAYYPHITASLSGQRTEYGRQTPTMVDRGTKLHRDVFAGGFDATWEIDIFGGSRRATEAAAATVESMDWSVADAWVSLTSEVGARYIELRTTQRRLEVARTNLVLQSMNRL